MFVDFCCLGNMFMACIVVDILPQSSFAFHHLSNWLEGCFLSHLYFVECIVKLCSASNVSVHCVSKKCTNFGKLLISTGQD